ncbi:S8 family serine peptidase [Pauljensenia hongkongensis]|uniref:Peptidase S8 n=1 Tax=Pauljensenia hongkongensis TaxID=178339 RepID=A0A1D8B1G4_9ACTO|nr:S8 family serine peptidase [Pauljensenia hongkongensis]AOS46976.1 peptidase S8 [Pauljensenia hongkongensis]EFW10362.1 hypothetical protein HMPREF9005_0657 [Actinomyces sp. oral taxon 178 str. F0338]
MSRTPVRVMLSAAVTLATALSVVAVSSPTAHAEGTPGITSAARERDEVMNYAVNLPVGASESDFATAVSKAGDVGGVVLAQYPVFNSFFVQSVKAAFAPDLGAALVAAGISYDSIGPTRYATVSGAEVKVDQNQGTPGENQAVAEAVANHDDSLSPNSQLNDFAPEGDADFTPDEGDANAWGLYAVGSVQAQQVDVPRAKVTVGVLDTGIDADHPDLKDQVDRTRSVGCASNGIADQDYSAWKDDHYHGTHVAGTIAAAHNGIGVDGVAPEATLVAIKTSNANGSFYPEYVTCAFTWAADHGVDVTNSSYYMDPWAFWLPNDPTQAAGLEAASRAVHYAHQKGVVNVAAEGNSNDDHDNPTVDTSSPNDVEGAAFSRDVTGGVDAPAMLNDDVISVSALVLPDGQDASTGVLDRAYFSNYGVKSVDVAAPGVRVWSTVPTRIRESGYAYLSGTSMASPHAAGVVALLKEIHPGYTADQLVALLKQQAGYSFDRLTVPADGKEYRGAGLVNALAAVTRDQEKPVVSAVEYSTDNETWQPLEGATLSGTVYVRATVTGSVTSASLDVAGLATVSKTVDEGADSVVVESGLIDLANLHLSGSDATPVNATVTAKGVNNDAAADDDVTQTVGFFATAVKTGRWINSGKGWSYQYSDGTHPSSEVVEIDGVAYRFDADGYLAYGWDKVDGNWYYYGANGRASGWTRVNSLWYYLDPSTGQMQIGWTKVGDSLYYLEATGVMTTGWKSIDGNWYLFDASGAMTTGWQASNGSWYYLNEDGTMATGWKGVDGYWYYLKPSGQMVTGTQWVDGRWQNFDSSGRWIG